MVSHSFGGGHRIPARARPANGRAGARQLRLQAQKGQSTLDWFCRSSSNTICGGGVDTIDVGAERPGAGDWMPSLNCPGRRPPGD